MKKNIKILLGFVMTLVFLVAAPATQSYAYSEIPDYFDFGEATMAIPAGGTHKIWLAATYDYTYFIEGATSDATYLECNFKRDSGYITIHIGADEQGGNVFFHFYVNDEKVQNQDIHDCIEVYVQNRLPLNNNLQVPIAGNKVGTLVKDGKRSMLYNDKGVAMASFSLSYNGKAAEYGQKGVENNGANYFSVATGYDGTKVMISESDKAVMLANGYAGVVANGKFINWP